MTKIAPSSSFIYVKDFQFKLQYKLKAFKNEIHETFKLPCSLVCTASRYGLLFVGTSTPKFQVIRIHDIQNYTVKDGDIANYKKRYVDLPCNPTHLSVNCDSSKLCVIVEKSAYIQAVVYDVVSFLKQDVLILQEIRLSTTPKVNILDVCWNPGVPSMFVACKDDGSLGLYNLEENCVEINVLPKTAGCTCCCWSPKGKQLVVGTLNGKLIQCKLDLQATKSINPPQIDGNPYPISIQWISNYQFIVAYKTVEEDNIKMSLIVVDAKGEATYTNYDDVFCSEYDARPYQIYMLQLPLWNILLVASSNGKEVSVMHLYEDLWTQWIPPCSTTAGLPLNVFDQKTLPVGIGIDISSIKSLPWGKKELPAMPYLFLLSHEGLLCCFSIVNLTDGIPQLCTPSEVVSDLSGLIHLTCEDSEKTQTIGLQEQLPIVSACQVFRIQPQTIVRPQIDDSAQDFMILRSGKVLKKQQILSKGCKSEFKRYFRKGNHPYTGVILHKRKINYFKKMSRFRSLSTINPTIAYSIVPAIATTTASTSAISTTITSTVAIPSIFGEKSSSFSQPLTEFQSLFAKTASSFTHNTPTGTALSTSFIFANTATTSNFTSSDTVSFVDQVETNCVFATSSCFEQTTSTVGDSILTKSICVGSTALSQTCTHGVFGQIQLQTSGGFGQINTTSLPNISELTLSTSSIFGENSPSESSLTVYRESSSASWGLYED